MRVEAPIFGENVNSDDLVISVKICDDRDRDKDREARPGVLKVV